jgi:hypothetical protein
MLSGRSPHAVLSEKTSVSRRNGLTMAPKLWPISWEITCHSVRPEVDTAVPETTAPPEFDVLNWHSVPSHAIPTWEPVGQLLIKCQSPAPSLPLVPRHWEKSERRLSKSTFGVLQLTFQGTVGSAVAGHLMESREACSRPRKGDVLRGILNLKLDDSKADVEGVLVSVSTRSQGYHSFSYFVQNTRSVPYGQDLP